MLDPQTLARIGDGPIIVALSGGGDSTALLHALAEHFGAARLRAVVVDHALRAGSENDARRAAAFAEALDVCAQIETLSWDANTNRAHEAAREARYAALCAAARTAGARVIVTGHTRDDQAETVWLRAERGSGLRGLAAMRAFAPAPIWPEGRGLWLARPLLSTRRDTLRAYLRACSAAWIEDPANANTIYARVRARSVLAELEAQGLDPMRLAALAERLAPHVEAVDKAAYQLIARAADFDAASIAADRGAFAGADAEVRQRALTALLTAAGGAARGPRAAQVARLDAALTEPDFEAMTLSGAVVRTRGEVIQFSRDRGALLGRADGAPPPPPLVLPAGVETVWDNRVALTMAETGWSVCVEAGTVQLHRGEERAALGAASPHWLLKDRVNHVLGYD